MKTIISFTGLFGALVLLLGCASDGDTPVDPTDHDHLHHEHVHEHGPTTHTHTRHYERTSPAPATGVRVDTGIDEDQLGL